MSVATVGRLLTAVTSSLMLALGAACSSDDPEPTPFPASPTPSATVSLPAPTASPAPSATTAPEPSATAPALTEVSPAFHAFVRDGVVPALEQGDVDFFAQRAKTDRIVCTPDNTPSLPGGPTCGAVGQEFEGLSLGHQGSEVWVVPLEEAMDLIELLIRDQVPSALDEHGGGAVQVFAVGIPEATWGVEGGQMAFWTDQRHHGAVITALIEQSAGARPIRASLILNWDQEGEEFLLLGVRAALTGGAELLTYGDQLWPIWERFEP